MAGHLDELKELAQAVMVAGEQVVAAADVLYAGKVNLHQSLSGMADLGHGEAQVAAGEALVARYGDNPGVAFPSAKQMAVVLTDRRLLLWSRGGLRGKPKAFIGEVPLDALTSTGFDGRHRLTILMGSGWEVQLDLTGDGDPVELVRGLQRLVGSTGSGAAGSLPAGDD